MEKRQNFRFWIFCLIVLGLLGLGCYLDTTVQMSLFDHELVEIITVVAIILTANRWISMEMS